MLCIKYIITFSGISSLLVKIPQITSYIISYIQVDKAIRGKFFIIGCNNLQYQDYLLDYLTVIWKNNRSPPSRRGYVRCHRDLNMAFVAPWFWASQFSRNSQWAISSRRAPRNKISFWERRPFEIATFISLVKSFAAGTALAKETHSPQGVATI